MDAASGINLNATLNLLNLGAKYVYACDFNPKLKKINKGKFKPFIGKYEVRLANLKNYLMKIIILILYIAQEQSIIQLIIRNQLMNYAELQKMVVIYI